VDVVAGGMHTAVLTKEGEVSYRDSILTFILTPIFLSSN